MQSLTWPLVVLDLESGRIVATNTPALSMLKVSRQDLVGEVTSRIIPDYWLPPRSTIKQWVEAAASGHTSGMPIDLLVQIDGPAPTRFSAHIGPADAHGRYLLMTLSQPALNGDEKCQGDEDVILGLMSDIGRIVGTSLDLEAVSQQFAISLMHVVPAEHVAILLMTDDGRSLLPVFSTGPSDGDSPIELVENGPIRKTVQTSSAVLLEELEISSLRSSGATAWPDFGRNMLTACCVPLTASGECIGVALMGSGLPGAFTHDDLVLLEHACSQVAGALSNVMLHDKLAQNALERDVLANIGRLSSAAIEFANAMPGIAAELNRLMPVSELQIHEPKDASGELIRSYVLNEPGMIARPDSPGSDTEAEKRNEALSCADPVIVDIRPPDGQGNIRSSVIAPLRFGGETIGTLTLSTPGEKPYSKREAMFASLVAGQVAGAVYTARAYRNQQRETNFRRSLAQISIAASRDLSLNSVFERIANEIAELVEYELFAIAIQSPERTSLNVRFHIGTDQVLGAYADITRDTATDSFPWQERIVRPARGPGQFAELADHGINALIEVSLGTRETGATGYILVGARDAGTFTDRELSVFAHVAEQVSPAIQNALAHEQAVALAEARMAEAKAEARNLELEKINDAKSQFLSIVSHELRTPLTSIMAYAELLVRSGDGNLTEKQRKQASVINKSATHLKFLISDLLDVSRIESGKLSLEMSTFRIADAVRDVVEQFEPVLAEKGQDLDVHIGDDNMQVHADRSRIVQIVSNLVENASKYSPPETVVTVNVHRRRSEVLITVSDQGIGISPEDQRQLFQPFFRANSDLTRTEPGTGLGLALVKSIAELHGGHVAVDSEPGGGSTFSLALRAASGQQAA